MRRSALPLLLLVACTSAQDAGEHVAAVPQPFASAHAVQLDFELDGKLVADTPDPAALRTLIEAQLLFTIGQLNGEGSVGRLGLLDLSAITATEIPPPPPPEPAPAPDDAGTPADAGDPSDAGDPGDAGAAEPPPPPPPPPPRYDVTYHAKMPVAWGGATIPSSYGFALPASVSAADQIAFAAKYGATCVDPAEAPAGADHMFAVYRPRQPGCVFAAGDVVSFTANVTPSSENTNGKYPEYHRVWQDGALDVVVLFSHEFATPTPGDGGAQAYDDFVSRMRRYMALLQPDATKRSEPPGLSSWPSAAGTSTVRLAAELPDGRTMKLDVRLVASSLDQEGPGFDDWYDGLTPDADVIVYNGHAGLGANVHALMEKGSFRSGQYLVWFANGCDTLAYVDRTLADRRAPLNPDDPLGTKYMDTVTNVMAGYFSALEATSVTFLRAFVEVRYPEVGPKTYEQIFQGLDPEQTVVVTGEEDNQLEPLPPSKYPPGPPPVEPEADAGAPRPAIMPPGEATSDPEAASPARTARGCGIGGIAGACDVGSGLAAGVLFAVTIARRRRRWRTFVTPRRA